jgi:hypothetical protein
MMSGFPKSKKSGTGDPCRSSPKIVRFQVEEDENVPDRLADDAVVWIVKVPLTVAVVPDAVSVTEKDAVPEPPATASSSASVSSIIISMRRSPDTDEL